MLSRIARGLYEMGANLERASNVARLLDVHHQMHLGNVAADAADVWLPIFEAFDLEDEAGPVVEGGERRVFEALVLSTLHHFSVRACISRAREEARTKRDHLSEEMWLHLNRYYLHLQSVGIDDILGRGRANFHAEVSTFCDGFQGIAHSTMVRDSAWHFLRLGRRLERARMLCRFTRLKIRTLSRMPEVEGSPVDYHQWQALLRSVSGYEPYRRTHSFRIVPAQVLDFLLREEDFPRSFLHCLLCIEESLGELHAREGARELVQQRVADFIEEVHQIDADALLRARRVEEELSRLGQECDGLEEMLEDTFFRSLTLVRDPGTGELQAQALQQ